MAEPTVVRMGRYEIVGLLATGGMAEILLGKLIGPSGFERPVVVKRILPHLARLPAFVNMFVDEARIVADIRHPNVVQVHELAHEGQELFLVMEYLEGESLGAVCRRLLKRSEALDRVLTAFVIAEACAGLHAAHELTDEDGFPRDLVHRDVSPQNIFLTYTGQVKLLDFGIAKAANRSTHTEAGQVKGKFAYMSPEQCLGRPLDRRSDVFALGIVLWELSTGRRLFARPSEHLTFKAICEERVPRPSDMVAGYPEALEGIVLRALARRPSDRHATAQELRRDLLAFARQNGLSDVPEEDLSRVLRRAFAERIEEKADMLRRFRVGSGPTAIPVAEPDEGVELPSIVDDLSTIHTASDVHAPEARESRGRRLLIPLVAVLVAAGIGAALFFQRPRESPALERSAVSPARSAALPPASASAAQQTKDVLVRVETTPPGAQIVLNGEEVGETPRDLSLPKSEAVITIELRLAGHLPRRERLTPNMNQRLVFSLTPAARPKAAKPAEIPRFR